jgi:bifunctional non-homologous end joining protein LigD
MPPVLAPMLATAGSVPHDPGYAFEFKWDGIRAIISVAGSHWRVLSRNGADITASFPELSTVREMLPAEPVTLDGEIVAIGAGGVPSFATLQRRMHVRDPGRPLLTAVPVIFYCFDILHLGKPLLKVAYRDRRELLDSIAPRGPHVDTPPSFSGVDGEDVLQAARDGGLEGVVSKRLDSLYLPGRRSPSWIKTPLWKTTEAVIGGWTPGGGKREGTLGALLLGMNDRAGNLLYVGNVGTGFSEATLRMLLGELGAIEQFSSPFVDEVPRLYAKVAHWTRPELVADVEYRNWTEDHRLRHPVYRGLRPDRTPAEILAPGR